MFLFPLYTGTKFLNNMTIKETLSSHGLPESVEMFWKFVIREYFQWQCFRKLGAKKFPKLTFILVKE